MESNGRSRSMSRAAVEFVLTGFALDKEGDDNKGCEDPFVAMLMEKRSSQFRQVLGIGHRGQFSHHKIIQLPPFHLECIAGADSAAPGCEEKEKR
jgi:hypothetical protein